MRFGGKRPSLAHSAGNPGRLRGHRSRSRPDLAHPQRELLRSLARPVHQGHQGTRHPHLRRRVPHRNPRPRRRPPLEGIARHPHPHPRRRPRQRSRQDARRRTLPRLATRAMPQHHPLPPTSHRRAQRARTAARNDPLHQHLPIRRHPPSQRARRRGLGLPLPRLPATPSTLETRVQLLCRIVRTSVADVPGASAGPVRLNRLWRQISDAQQGRADGVSNVGRRSLPGRLLTHVAPTTGEACRGAVAHGLLAGRLSVDDLQRQRHLDQLAAILSHRRSHGLP